MQNFVHEWEVVVIVQCSVHGGPDVVWYLLHQWVVFVYAGKEAVSVHVQEAAGRDR